MGDGRVKKQIRDVVHVLAEVSRRYGRPVRQDSREILVLKGLYGEDLKVGLPQDHPDWNAGAVPDRNAFWFRRATAPDLFGCDGCWDVFYDRSSLYNRLLSSWAAIAAEAVGALTKRQAQAVDIERAWLDQIFDLPVDAPFIPVRAFIFGVEDGVFCLGYRDGPAVAARLQTMDRAERAQLLLQPIEPLNVDAFPGLQEEPCPEWWGLAGTPLERIQRGFVLIARDILKERGPLERLSGSLDIAKQFTESDAAVVTYANDLASQSLSTALARARLTCESFSARTLILAVPASMADAEIAIRSPKVLADGFTRYRVLLFCIDHVVAALRRSPWLWSKHLGQDSGFRLFCNDPFALLTNMIREATGRRVLRKSDAPRHPEISGRRLSASARLRIIGRSGSGKTAAMYQLLRDVQKNALIVLLPPRINRTAAKLLKAVLSTVPAVRSMRIFVAIDDIEQVKAGDEECSLRVILAILRTGPIGASVGLIVTYGRTEAQEVTAQYAGLFQEAGMHRRIMLDYPPQEFFSSVAQAYADSHNAILVEAYRIGILSNVYEYENTLSTLTMLLDRRDWNLSMRGALADLELLPAELAKRPLLWRSKLERLLAEPDARHRSDLLQLLAAFDFLGFSDPKKQLLETYFCELNKVDSGVLRVAAESLEQSGWLQRHGERFHVDRVQVFAVQFEMQERGVFDRYLWALLNWTVSAKNLDASSRDEILSSALWRLRSADQPSDSLVSFVRHVVFHSERFHKDYLDCLMEFRRQRNEIRDYCGEVTDLLAARAHDHVAILSAVGMQLQIGFPDQRVQWKSLWGSFEWSVFGSSSLFSIDIGIRVLQQIDRAVSDVREWRFRTGREVVDSLPRTHAEETFLREHPEMWRRTRERCVRRLVVRGADRSNLISEFTI